MENDARHGRGAGDGGCLTAITPFGTTASSRFPVADLRRTIAFYVITLGFRPSVVWPDDASTFCILDRDAIRVGFFVPDGEHTIGTPGGCDIVLEVDNVRALHETLEPNLKVEWGPEVYSYGRREFAVRDPDGYLLIFSEETSDPPTCET